jgi:hypothetical protein
MYPAFVILFGFGCVTPLYALFIIEQLSELGFGGLKDLGIKYDCDVTNRKQSLMIRVTAKLLFRGWGKTKFPHHPMPAVFFLNVRMLFQ